MPITPNDKRVIPISKPILGSEELASVQSVLASGMLAQGEVVKSLELEFAKYIGTRYCVATNSGTSALHTVLAALGIGEGDEVVTTTFSFVATASCILMQRATPLFVDICPNTYNISPDKIEAAITERTRAIIVVHLYGQPCDMDPIMEIARGRSIFVIEDACQAHGAEYKGKRVGSIGHAGVFSFYPTKNMTTGEGGAITTNDEQMAALSRTIREHGQKRRYWHETLGYNYRMTDIAAAIGLAQLRRLESLNQRRSENATYYLKGLRTARTPFVMDNVRHVFHLFTIRVPQRDRFAAYLQSNGIGYGIHYPCTIHKQPLFKEYSNIVLPAAEKASQEVISLPVHPALSNDDVNYILEVVNSFDG